MYIVKFIGNGVVRSSVWIAGYGISDIKDGFWVDKNWKSTNITNDLRYWIPPSQILFIEKTEDH